MYTPSLEQFRELARQGNLIPVARQILADMETPVSAFRKIDSGNYAFLLESVEGGEQWGRYSFLGSNPSLVVRARGERVEILQGQGAESVGEVRDPFAALQTILARHRAVAVPGLPRFTGGLVGFLGYDTVRHLERLPSVAAADLGFPDALFLLTDTLLIFDNVTHRITVVSNAAVRDESDDGVERTYRESQQKIDAIIAALRRPVGAPAGFAGPSAPAEPDSTFTRHGFCEAVRKAKARRPCFAMI